MRCCYLVYKLDWMELKLFVRCMTLVKTLLLVVDIVFMIVYIIKKCWEYWHVVMFLKTNTVCNDLGVFTFNILIDFMQNILHSGSAQTYSSVRPHWLPCALFGELQNKALLCTHVCVIIGATSKSLQRQGSPPGSQPANALWPNMTSCPSQSLG